MELHEKLQQLRKQKGLTQEELAETLYVSRTAISKWESGRGLPSIESLKAISRYFSVSLDALLSGEELLSLAEQDQKEQTTTICDLLFGLLDCGMALLLFLPFFGQKADGLIQSTSLLALKGVQAYLKTVYLLEVCASVSLGIVTLALQNCRHSLWMRSKHLLSLALSTAGVCLFMVSQQPYGAAFTFTFLMIKTFLLLKRR